MLTMSFIEGNFQNQGNGLSSVALTEERDFEKYKITNAHNGHNYLFSPFRNTFRTRSQFQGTTFTNFISRKLARFLYDKTSCRMIRAYLNLDSWTYFFPYHTLLSRTSHDSVIFNLLKLYSSNIYAVFSKKINDQ